MGEFTPIKLAASASALARRGLRSCGYRDDLIRDDYPLPLNRKGLVGFAHRPFDSRSACIVILPLSPTPEEDVAACRETGASLYFLAADKNWQVWVQTQSSPRLWDTISSREAENYFEGHKQEFEPGVIFRAKTWQRAGIGRQLDFVDAGFLPMLEQEAGRKLLDLFERMVVSTMHGLGWRDVPSSSEEAHWLTQANFWLFAAKILHDKRVPRFINLDLQDIPTVFQRVGDHYQRGDCQSPRFRGRLSALQDAAGVAVASPNFRNISAESLGMLYEEALISRATRKLLGTHRTPTYLVDYMLGRLSVWIEELGYQNCRVFEPACGNAPFLLGALRLLSDRLPPSIADDPKFRHRYLRDHLRGSDNDTFALEIARLCLTLADIPNENGWVLKAESIFVDEALARETKAATVILANPPFEQEKAAQFFRQVVQALQPGAVFGFVLPINELSGAASADTRQTLLSNCEIKEISVFPDRMFKFASVETGIVLGRKLAVERGAVSPGIRFRRVRESKIDGFRERYEDSWRDEVTADWLLTANAGRLVVPELHCLWDACRDLPKFEQFADIGQGLIHRSKQDPAFPEGALTESREEAPGLVEGFASVNDSPDTHLLPSSWWLNLHKSTIRRPVAGRTTGVPQVVMNYAPVDRDVWRLKAFLDPVGRPATSDFLVVRPNSLPLECIWAICNSPLANAFAFAHGSKRHTTAGVFRKLPIPELSEESVKLLGLKVRAYFKAAGQFSKKFQASPTKLKFDGKQGKASGVASAQMRLGIESDPAEEEISAARERLRALHWRVDAEVLRLYELPPEMERQLLDAFDGVRRVGVPFEQGGYIPRDFREARTLDEYLRITDEWEITDSRRCELIEKRIKVGVRTPEEEAEFRQLQRLFTLRRRLFSPLPTEEIRALARKIREDSE